MDNNKENKHRDLKTIIMIIIIIIIILLLITSCTTGLLGKIGNAFNTEDTIEIKPDDGEEELIINRDLIFNSDNIELYESDINAKLSYSYKNINPKDLTCITSDANIAVCYVKDGYVVINPKGIGLVDIILESKINGKTYRAISKANIKEASKYISLSRKKGTINLYKSKNLKIAFDLIRINGKVKVYVEDESIASATIKDNVLNIVGKKKGSTNITLKVTCDGKTYEATFNVNVVDSTPSNVESSKNKLKSLKVSDGVLSPSFDENITNYTVVIPEDVSKFSMEEDLKSSKSKVKYRFNGEEVDSLKDLELKDGDNVIEVEVTDEEGNTTTYTIVVKKENNKNSSGLKDIVTPEGLNLNQEFNKDILSYEMDVSFYEDRVALEALKENNNSKVTYRFNGKNVNSLDNLKLQYGENKLEITVEDELGNTKTYTITIYRAQRKVEIINDSYTVYLDNGTTQVIYEIYEYDRNTSKWYKVDDYTKDDVLIEFSGSYNKGKGTVSVIPRNEDVGTTKKLVIKYGDSTDSTNIIYKKYEYFLNAESNSYEITVNEEGKIVLNNNLFNGNIVVEKTENGIIIYDANNRDNYIIIEGDIEITYDNSTEGTNSLVINVKSDTIGKHNVSVKGSVNGGLVNSFNITVNIVKEYIVNIYANGGLFNELTEEYNLKFENKATLKLSDYIAYLEKDCQYYKVVGYSERKNATINDSDVYSIDEEIQITKSMNLYAIYSTVPTEEIPDEEKWIYLVEEELFYNEEYEKAYGIKNMIYPGVHGEHIMNIDNNSGKDITIKGVSLEELNTVCVDVGCVNMGYKISTNDTLYYHDNNDYKILNKDTYIDNYKGAHNMNLEVKNKESTRISLAWKWLDNDVVDTKIGKSITDLNNEYQIVVGLKISTKDSKCSKD